LRPTCFIKAAANIPRHKKLDNSIKLNTGGILIVKSEFSSLCKWAGSWENVSHLVRHVAAVGISVAFPLGRQTVSVAAPMLRRLAGARHERLAVAFVRSAVTVRVAVAHPLLRDAVAAVAPERAGRAVPVWTCWPKKRQKLTKKIQRPFKRLCKWASVQLATAGVSRTTSRFIPCFCLSGLNGWKFKYSNQVNHPVGNQRTAESDDAPLQTSSFAGDSEAAAAAISRHIFGRPMEMAKINCGQISKSRPRRLAVKVPPLPSPEAGDKLLLLFFCRPSAAGSILTTTRKERNGNLKASPTESPRIGLSISIHFTLLFFLFGRCSLVDLFGRILLNRVANGFDLPLSPIWFANVDASQKSPTSSKLAAEPHLIQSNSGQTEMRLHCATFAAFVSRNFLSIRDEILSNFLSFLGWNSTLIETDAAPAEMWAEIRLIGASVLGR
jgi:hypothetical protein